MPMRMRDRFSRDQGLPSASSDVHPAADPNAPLDPGEPIEEAALVGELLPPLDAHDAGRWTGDYDWSARRQDGATDAIDVAAAMPAAERGPPPKPSAGRRPAVSGRARAVQRPALRAPRRAARKTVRLLSASGLAALVLISTADLSRPLQAFVDWTTPKAANRIVSAPLGTVEDPAKVEGRVAGARDTQRSRTLLAQVEMPQGEDASSMATNTGDPSAPVPAVKIHSVDLTPIDQRNFPKLTSRATAAGRPALLESALQSIEAPPSAYQSAPVPAPVAQDRPSGTAAGLIAASVPSIAPAPQPATPVPVRISVPRLQPASVVKQAAAPALRTGPAFPASQLDKRQAARQNGDRAVRDALPAPIVPAPVRLVSPVPRRTLHAEGSLKDGPMKSVPLAQAGGTIVMAGSLALTAYQGEARSAQTAYAPQPLPADPFGSSAWHAVPAWAHAWLVDRTDPIDAFRQVQ
jgi:hypothetical protein